MCQQVTLPFRALVSTRVAFCLKGMPIHSLGQASYGLPSTSSIVGWVNQTRRIGGSSFAGWS